MLRCYEHVQDFEVHGVRVEVFLDCQQLGSQICVMVDIWALAVFSDVQKIDDLFSNNYLVAFILDIVHHVQHLL